MVGPTGNTRSLTSDSLRPGRVSNPVPSKYKPEVRWTPALLRRASQQSWSVDKRQFAKAVVTLVTVCEQKGLQAILKACQGAAIAQSVQWLCYERWFDCRHRQPVLLICEESTDCHRYRWHFNGREGDHSSHLVWRLRISGTVPPHPHVPLSTANG
jgi:hypothetical protein